MEKIGRNDPCWCGSGRKYKQCHEAFDEKIRSFALQGHIVPDHSMIKTPEQIAGIRESGLINIAVLDYVADNYKALQAFFAARMPQVRLFPMEGTYLAWAEIGRAHV